MKKNEVLDLMKYIKAAYPLFLKDNEPAIVFDLWYRSLKDFEYERVLDNLIQYSKENEYPPKIKDLVEGLVMNERYNIPGVEETKKIIEGYMLPPEQRASQEFIDKLKKEFMEKINGNPKRLL